jgi:hypothetical protein
MYRRLRTTETTDAFSEFLAEHPGLWPRRDTAGDTDDPFNEFASEPEPVEDRWLTVARGRQITAKVHDYRHAMAVASVFLSVFMPAGIISTFIVGRELTVTPLQRGRSSLPPLPASLFQASLDTRRGVPAVDLPTPTRVPPPVTAEPPRALEPRSAPLPIARPTQAAVSPSASPQVSTPSNVLPLTSAVISSAANSSVTLPPVPPPPVKTVAAPTTAGAPVTAPAPRVDLPVGSAVPPSGPPVVPSAPPAVSSAPPPVRVTAPPPPAPAPPAPARAAAPDIAAENSAVRAVIDRYRTAFSRLDAGSAKAVWPGVDERALSRAFGQMTEQQFIFDACSIDVNGARATASCRGRAQYIPKIGSRSLRVDMRQWAFTLRRTDRDWTIESVDSR